MKIYLAGRLDEGEGIIDDFSDELESRGHIVLEKWFKGGRLPKPYMENPETSRPAANAMIKAAFESDIFILHPTEDILGAAVELGAATASTLVNESKQLIVINPWEIQRQSIFYAHPAVIAVHGLDEVRHMEWY